jgi:hypothetical protein
MTFAFLIKRRPIKLGKEKASVVDGMKWKQPLLREIPRLVDDSERRRANKG